MSERSDLIKVDLPPAGSPVRQSIVQVLERLVEQYEDERTLRFPVMVSYDQDADEFVIPVGVLSEPKSLRLISAFVTNALSAARPRLRWTLGQGGRAQFSEEEV